MCVPFLPSLSISLVFFFGINLSTVRHNTTSQEKQSLLKRDFEDLKEGFFFPPQELASIIYWMGDELGQSTEILVFL